MITTIIIIVLIVFGGLMILGFIAGLVEGDKGSSAGGHSESFSSKSKTSTTRTTTNNTVNIKIGAVIIEPEAISRLGDAGARLLQNRSLYFDRSRGMFVLELKNQDEIPMQMLRQLADRYSDDD